MNLRRLVCNTCGRLSDDLVPEGSDLPEGWQAVHRMEGERLRRVLYCSDDCRAVR
jgi:uncharacterized protein YbdZ (MbtH family)